MVQSTIVVVCGRDIHFNASAFIKSVSKFEHCRFNLLLISNRRTWKLPHLHHTKDMSTAQSIVDADGNINSKYLTKELKEALEADVHYRQTDNMKKRAVKVSTDYNEFKNMVAAAHLKKLTSKEVESLSHVKKGWQKVATVDKSSSAIILNKELEQDLLLECNKEGKLALKVGGDKPKPKNTMEIERDLRRLNSTEEKLRYLYAIGLKKAKALMSSAGDTDLLEQVVNILCWNKADLISNANVHGVPVVDTPTTVFSASESQQAAITPVESAGDNVGAAEKVPAAEPNVLDVKLRVKWLKAVSEFDRFDLMVRFVSATLLADVVEILDAQTVLDVSEIRKKYCKSRSS